MKKAKQNLIYRIYVHDENYGRGDMYKKLIIEVQDAIGHSENIVFKYQANVPDKDNFKWYGLNFEYYPSWHFDLFHIVNKVVKYQKESYFDNLKPEQLIQQLEIWGITQGTYVQAYDDNHKHIFDGLLNKKEIILGKFNRYYTNQEFILPPIISEKYSKEMSNAISSIYTSLDNNNSNSLLKAM